MGTNINLNEYVFPTHSGKFIGTLICKKKLENKDCLMCYFLSDDNEKIVLSIWKNNKTGKYSPEKSSVCFMNDIKENTQWDCEYTVKKSSTGKNQTIFLSADKVIDLKEKEKFFSEKFFILLIKKAFPRTLAANIKTKKITLSDEIFYSGFDKSNAIFYYINCDNDGNYSVKRIKQADNKERDTKVIIDRKSFDIISKSYS